MEKYLMDKDELKAIETHTFELILFNIRNVVSRGLCEHMKLISHYDILADQFVNQLSFYLVGNQTHEEEYEDDVRTYPATMWEELKEYWPKWLKKRYPIRYARDVQHISKKYIRVCPHLDVPSSSDNSIHIKYLLGGEVG